LSVIYAHLKDLSMQMQVYCILLLLKR
jgi:hypothetical protein